MAPPRSRITAPCTCNPTKCWWTRLCGWGSGQWWARCATMANSTARSVASATLCFSQQLAQLRQKAAGSKQKPLSQSHPAHLCLQVNMDRESPDHYVESFEQVSQVGACRTGQACCALPEGQGFRAGVCELHREMERRSNGRGWWQLALDEA